MFLPNIDYLKVAGYIYRFIYRKRKLYLIFIKLLMFMCMHVDFLYIVEDKGYGKCYLAEMELRKVILKKWHPSFPGIMFKMLIHNSVKNGYHLIIIY